ncbi:hypothetical protein ACO2Q0_20490 [Phenylobacterium sp. VNQ135]|uniref:hypothetical protein n=1 Tax=Phenylobacterium sp. VNQ135 TaxID=3400922 RepID=UPI003C11FD80
MESDKPELRRLVTALDAVIRDASAARAALRQALEPSPAEPSPQATPVAEVVAQAEKERPRNIGCTWPA